MCIPVGAHLSVPEGSSRCVPLLCELRSQARNLCLKGRTTGCRGVTSGLLRGEEGCSALLHRASANKGAFGIPRIGTTSDA